MLIEVGPRTIGKCNLKFEGCTGRKFSIVKKVLLAKDGQTAWVCQSCLIRKVRDDRREVMQEPNPMKKKQEQEA
ncbi:MAG: hypothetical protein CME70_08775 [Halobacteriovorax sp.]|nr:hypothetical protein [Halobacteriovorax sp.]|tara:strand:- start:90309 stop:90530 length:222 start_codon:yes stop_codon:yes gene_type:complete